MIAAAVGAALVGGIVLYALAFSGRLVPGAAVAPGSLPSLPPPAQVGSAARPISVQAGQLTITSAMLAGKPYILEIFATWCPHCQHEVEVLKKVRARYPASKLSIVSVTGSPYAMDATPNDLKASSQADVDLFDARFGVSWPSIYDANLTVARMWGMSGFPTIYVVDAKGTIIFSQSGEVPEGELTAALAKAGL